MLRGGCGRLASTAPVRCVVVPDAPWRAAAGVLPGGRVRARSLHLACHASTTAPRRHRSLSPHTPRHRGGCAGPLAPASSAMRASRRRARTACRAPDEVLPQQAPPHTRVEKEHHSRRARVIPTARLARHTGGPSAWEQTACRALAVVHAPGRGWGRRPGSRRGRGAGGPGRQQVRRGQRVGLPGCGRHWRVAVSGLQRLQRPPGGQEAGVCGTCVPALAGSGSRQPPGSGLGRAGPNIALEPTPTASARASLRLLARLTAGVRLGNDLTLFLVREKNVGKTEGL